MKNLNRKSRVVAMMIAVVTLSATVQMAAAHDMVAGALPQGANAQTLTLGPYDQNKGEYTLTIGQPTAVFFTDPNVPGVVAQPDTNPLRKGKSVWVVNYAQLPSYFEGATIHVCKLQGEWTCGSGEIDKILADSRRPSR
jgi:hypothetical protein